jgi:hypothetical protein
MARKTATGDEAAAVAAAIARFESELASAPTAEPEPYGGWQRAALLEGVSAKERPKDPQGGEKWQS